MGQAKQRRDRFGTEGRHMVKYREAETVIAFKYTAAHKSKGSAGIMAEALYYPRTPSVFDPDLPTVNPPAIQAAYMDELEGRNIDEGDYVVVDPVSLTIRDIQQAKDFEAQFDRLSGTNGWYARKGDDGVLAIITRDNQVILEGGKLVEDLVEFCRGKVRHSEYTLMRADSALSVQAVQLMFMLGDAGGVATSQLAHVTALALEAKRRSWSMPSAVTADLKFFQNCEAGGEKFPIPADTDPFLYPVAAFTEISELTGLIPSTPAARIYCRMASEPLSVFLSRQFTDPLEWAQIEGCARVLSETAGDGVMPGKDAVRTTLALSNPAVGPYLARLNAFFAAGRQVGVASLPEEGAVEAVDIENVRYLVVTTPNKTMDVVGWTV